MGAAGRERGSVSAGNASGLRQSPNVGGAQSGAHRDDGPAHSPHSDPATDPELARLVEAWPNLTDDQRRRILTIAGEPGG
jgi:hypothetical protein